MCGFPAGMIEEAKELSMFAADMQSAAEAQTTKVGEPTQHASDSPCLRVQTGEASSESKYRRVPTPEETTPRGSRRVPRPQQYNKSPSSPRQVDTFAPNPNPILPSPALAHGGLYDAGFPGIQEE
jgi:hypothetical protein